MELQEKYEIQEVLGVGSTSTCHKCTCRATNLPYACKIIDKQHIDEKFQGMMQQFHVEIDALRKLDHPSIIQLYDVYITTDKIFIIMEIMEGGELFDYVVQKGTLTEEEASKLVKSVTSAMVYMHSKNVSNENTRAAKHRGDIDTVYLLISIPCRFYLYSHSPLHFTMISINISLALLDYPSRLETREFASQTETRTIW